MAYEKFSKRVLVVWKAFVRAWSDACKSFGDTRVLIPGGEYMLRSVTFNGPCKGSITFQISGVLKAPIDPALLSDQKWINFRYVDKLTVNGGGTLNGQGTATRQKCRNNSCQILFVVLSSLLSKFISVKVMSLRCTLIISYVIRTLIQKNDLYIISL